MKKMIIAIVMVFCILVQNVSYGYVVRKADIRNEKIIPFSFISNNIFLEEDVSIKGLDNVEIEKVYVDNGEVEAYIDGNYINLELNGGEKSNNLKTITKTDILEIEDIKLSDEKNKLIKIDSKKDIKEIKEVSGDFESANISSNGLVEIKVSKDAKGIQGYDESQMVKSEVIVKVDENNRLRELESEWVDLEHEIVGGVKAKRGDTSAVDEIIFENNSIKVLFNNGVPKLNEITVNDGYTYFWIDRDSDGVFKKYNPNSIYSTDKNKISGKGKYLDENQSEELSIMLSNSKWTNYCGVDINGVRYIYLFDKEKGIPDNLNGEIVTKDFVEFTDQAFNTEKYTVYFSEDGVLYIPEGKLYSMGELVSGTSGWGEVSPNHDWESKETFFNEITGKYETYVKHYKFFYGPKNKKAFGGFYTYPYNCTIEYEHYKPTKLYSGQVVYTYDSEEYIRGYLYNGWIKISYTENKTINDYPPTSPYNIKYDSSSNLVSWEHGTDDYTPQNKLSYEIQMYSGLWGDITKTDYGENNKKIIIDYNDYDIRVRTVDEVGQVSEWSNLSDNVIELTGKVIPSIIKAGENIKITANTKSLSKIDSVKAKSESLGIDCELQKISEKVPEYIEISYDIYADFLEEDDYIYSDNKNYAVGKKGHNTFYYFSSNKKTDDSELKILLPDDIEFTKNGTIVFPNGNYLNTPLNIFTYSGKRFYLHMRNELGIRNKISGKEERFIAFENDSKLVRKNNDMVYRFFSKLIINTFEYDEKNMPKYIEVEVDKNIGDKPIIIRWNTDVSGVTRFDISIDNKNIYSYTTDYSIISKYVGNIKYEKINKCVKRYVLTTYGYELPSKRVTVDWSEIVIGLIPQYKVDDFPWLGYRVKNNEYVRDEYTLNYNNNPNVRNTYRTLILDEYASDIAIKKYLNLIRSTNFPIKSTNRETVFADDILEYNCEFELENIKIDSNVIPGKYPIELIATDIDGNSNKIILTVIVENDENAMYPEEEEPQDIEIIKPKDILVGRFFYKNGQGYLEELKRTKKNSDTEGFISAGETLGINFFADNVDFIEIDFIGDKSIKTLDSLTKLFLIEKPKANGKNVDRVSLQYENFPKIIYPISTNSNGEREFRYFYTIPYGTKQNIHSWSTLRNSTLENLDTNKLFNRINSPYSIKITLNGDENISYDIPFDIFERWDTVINRDVSDFIINSDTKWKIRIDKE